MAKTPAAPAVGEAEQKASSTLADETEARLTAARMQKSYIEQDLREALFLTRPRLSRQVLSTTVPQAPPRDMDQLATSIGSEVTEDFATEVINGFMPPNTPWASSEAGEGVPDDVWKQVKDQAVANDGIVFQALRASNFDAELATSLVPNASIGTHAMLIDDHWAHEPLLCQDVPLRELEINVGPYGGVDDRFMVRHVHWRKVPALFPKAALAKLSATKRDMITSKPDEWAECRWGYWRDWTIDTDVVWQYVVQIAGDVVDQGAYRGEGSCPLLVGRFSPDSTFSWGNGPTLDSLPYLRIHDTLAQVTQEHAPLLVRPPFAYPDDGIMNFDGGIEDGKAYPKRPGSSNEIEPLMFTGAQQLAFFTIENIEKAIRRKHFADYPDQPGKTPPTATQWLDEMVKSQRRIGTPGQKYWREFPCEVVLRVKYLLEKRGVLKPLAAKGSRAVATRPQNPATKAQDNQELQTAAQILSYVKQFFPMTSQAAIDELATIANIKEKAGDTIIVLRDKGKVEGLIQQMLQGAGGALGGQGAPAAGQQPQGPAA